MPSYVDAFVLVVPKKNLAAILDRAKSARLNAVVLQVRAAGDAIFPSTLEPWARTLTGTQGVDPGWDPLSFAVTAAHERGLERLRERASRAPRREERLRRRPEIELRKEQLRVLAKERRVVRSDGLERFAHRRHPFGPSELEEDERLAP